jgi:hypothetical protein
MDLVWSVNPSDVDRVRRLILQHEGDPFVQARARRNLADNKHGTRSRKGWTARKIGCLPPACGCPIGR